MKEISTHCKMTRQLAPTKQTSRFNKPYTADHHKTKNYPKYVILTLLRHIKQKSEVA